MGVFRITHESKFIDGVNYQLHYGYDFGEHNSAPGMGLHSEERLEQVRKDFSMLAASGVHSVRVNVFTDGRAGIIFDDKGRALGVQDSVARGLLNVLHVADDNNIVASLVMLDHTFAERTERLDRRRPEIGAKQGHGRVLMTEAGRNELLNNVFKPLLQELSKEKPASLFSIELVNEPESLIEGLSTDTNMPGLLPAADLGKFKAFVRTFRDLVHQETGAQFTVGSLAVRHADMWLDVLDPACDYLSIHYYGRNDEPPFHALYDENVSAAPLKTVRGLQRKIPMVWGEYAANGSSEFVNQRFPQGFSKACQFLEDALNNHVKGAYAWAVRSGTGDWGDLFGPVPLEQHRKFTAMHAHRIEFAGALPPSPSTPGYA